MGMDDTARTFLFDLLSTPSPTGFELAGQRKWAAFARQFAHRVENDAYGSVWATMDGAGSTPRRVQVPVKVLCQGPPSALSRTFPLARAAKLS